MRIRISIFFWLVCSWSFAQDITLFQKEVFIQDKDSLKYRVLYPENFQRDSIYPLVLFLHGAGERGNDNEKQLTHGSSLFLNGTSRKNFPAVVIFPQCTPEDYWANVSVGRTTFPLGLDFHYEKGPTKAMELVMQLLEHTLREAYINKSQVYVVGLSMGGMGTYELLFRKSELFAAAIPICGGGEPKSVSKYATNVPIWAFHGAQDNVVDPQRSIEMISSILSVGGVPKFTLFEDANHNSWDQAFNDPNFLPWLFSHQKKL